MDNSLIERFNDENHEIKKISKVSKQTRMRALFAISYALGSLLSLCRHIFVIRVDS